MIEWFRRNPVIICVMFMFLSTGATLHNKFIFDHVLKSSNCLLLVQNAVTLIVLLIMRRAGVVVFHSSVNTDWLAGFFYAANVVCGLWSLTYVNVVMFGVLKRCTILVTWSIEFLFSSNHNTVACLPSLLVMMVGTLTAGHYDTTFSMLGYSLAAASCFTQGIAFELSQRAAKRSHGVCSVLYSNSVASLILLAVILFVNGELRELISRPITTGLILHLILNSCTCLALNFFVFLNCYVNSPLAHTVTGNMKIVLTSTLGVILFATPLSGIGFVGLCLNFLGGGWFSWIKMKASKTVRSAKHSIV